MTSHLCVNINSQHRSLSSAHFGGSIASPKQSHQIPHNSVTSFNDKYISKDAKFTTFKENKNDLVDPQNE